MSELDYSQVKLRVERWGRGHLTSTEMHMATAADIFDVKPEEVTTEQWRAAKAVNYGVAYGLSEKGVAKVVERIKGKVKP